MEDMDPVCEGLMETSGAAEIEGLMDVLESREHRRRLSWEKEGAPDETSSASSPWLDPVWNKPCHVSASL
jgi:hypothetical protein